MTVQKPIPNTKTPVHVKNVIQSTFALVSSIFVIIAPKSCGPRNDQEADGQKDNFREGHSFARISEIKVSASVSTHFPVLIKCAFTTEKKDSASLNVRDERELADATILSTSDSIEVMMLA